MPESLLRDLQCRAAKPRERVYRLSDGGSLSLLIKPNGLKYWQFRYSKPDGREGLIQIGPYPRITLEAARAARNAHRANVQCGIDPAMLHKQKKPSVKRRLSAPLLSNSALPLISKHAKQNGPVRNMRSNGKTRLRLTLIRPSAHCSLPLSIPIWYSACSNPVWLIKNETASRLRGRIENILDWAKVRGLRGGENPARWHGHLDQLLAAPAKVQKPQHHSALPYTEISVFVATLRSMPGMAARALEFTILTAMRTGEVIGAYLEECDLAAQLWTVPAERMKAKRPHRVPLSSTALALLSALPMSKNGPLFEGMRPRRPLSNMAMLKVLERTGYGALTVHGFLLTFRDWAAECTSYPNEVVEMALAHTIRDKTEAAYRRRDIFEKRRALMQAWADYIEHEVATAPSQATAQSIVALHRP